MRAFVTGARGFVGRWLISHLTDAGAEVLTPHTDITDGPAIRGSISDARPDQVFHLAAVSDPARAVRDPEAARRVNGDGTANVLAAAASIDPPPVVLVTSSSAVYLPSDVAIDELSPTGGDHPYVASKLLAEAACEAYQGSPLRVVVARAFNHTGAGQPTLRVVPALGRAALLAAETGDRVVVAGDLSLRRDITDVRDVVRAYAALATAADAGVFNVCSGRGLLLADIARDIAALAGVADPVFKVDPSRVHPDDPPSIVGNPAKLNALTGWSPRIPLKQTLADVVAALR